MPDQFTVTTKTGLCGRMMSSIKGILVGIILFLGSFVVLYLNEGRADLSVIAKTATEISADAPAPGGLQGKLISVTGSVDTKETIGDNLFLKPGNFIAVQRVVEMYAWNEESKTERETSFGGSETKKTTYTYSTKWTEKPEASSRFNRPEGHFNPEKAIESAVVQAADATVGIYHFDPQSIALPEFSPHPLTSESVTLVQGAVMPNDKHLYIKKSADGTYEQPRVGDLRISYLVLKPGFRGTAFGKLNGGNIDAFADKDEETLYRLFAEGRDTAITALHGEYVRDLWLLRLVGFLMMLFGLFLLFEPVSVFLDIVPVFGKVSRAVIGFASFIVALVLSLVTILISAIAHNVIALIIGLALTIAALIFFVKMKRKKLAPQKV